MGERPEGRPVHLLGENSHCWHDDAHGNPFGKNGKCRSKQASAVSVFYFSFLNSVRAQVLYNGQNVENNEYNPFVLFPKMHDSWQMSSRRLFFKRALPCQSVQQNTLSDTISKGPVCSREIGCILLFTTTVPQDHEGVRSTQGTS